MAVRLYPKKIRIKLLQIKHKIKLTDQQHNDTIHCYSIWSDYTVIDDTTTTPPQPFYDPFSGTTRVSRCQKGRLTEADTPTSRLGANPSGLTSAHLSPSPIFTGRMPFLPPNQQCQSIRIREKTLEFSTVLPAPFPYLVTDDTGGK